jgi:hypothetical protein
VKGKCSFKGCAEPPYKFGKCRGHFSEWQAASQRKYADKQRAKPKQGKISPSKPFAPPTRTTVGKTKDRALAGHKKPKQAHISPRTSRHDRSRKEYRLIVLNLGREWERDGRNHCMECGAYVPVVEYSEASGQEEPNYTAFAHVVGRGECGGREAIVNDPDNLACMCATCHTGMDQGGGTQDTKGERWAFMECRDRLMEIWNFIWEKHGR